MSRKPRLWGGAIVLVLFSCWTMMPITLMVYASLSGTGIAAGARGFPSLGSFAEVLLNPTSRFWDAAAYSALISGLGAVASVLLAAPAAFAIACGKDWGPRVGHWIFSTRFLPPAVAAVPLFVVLSTLRSATSTTGLFLVELLVGVPLATYVLALYMREFPRDLLALIASDELSRLKALRYVVLPILARPIAAASAVTWLAIYNEYFLALIFSGSKQTLPVVIASWNTYQGVQWGPACAAGLLAAVPALLVLGLAYRSMARVLSFGLGPSD